MRSLMPINPKTEDEFRTLLIDQLKQINSLKNEIEQLKRTVADEQEAKYRAYIKIADLNKKLQTTV